MDMAYNKWNIISPLFDHDFTDSKASYLDDYIQMESHCGRNG